MDGIQLVINIILFKDLVINYLLKIDLVEIKCWLFFLVFFCFLSKCRHFFLVCLFSCKFMDTLNNNLQNLCYGRKHFYNFNSLFVTLNNWLKKIQKYHNFTHFLTSFSYVMLIIIFYRHQVLYCLCFDVSFNIYLIFLFVYYYLLLGYFVVN